MEKPIAQIEHKIAQRVRLKIPSARGNPAFLESLVAQLAKDPEIEDVSANPITGSIVIRHMSDDEAASLLERHGGLFELRADEPQSASLPAIPFPELDSGQLSSLAWGLFGLALYQASQGRLLGSAAENLWYAYGAQRLLNNQPLAFAFAALGLYQFLRGNILGSASTLLFYSLVVAQVAESSVDSSAPSEAPIVASEGVRSTTMH
jgi:hypothetical protein